MVFTLRTLSIYILYLYQFGENICKGLRVIERTRNPYQNFQKGIIP